MPAPEPIAAARPQPTASIQLTRMPTSRAESGFCAAARIARPIGVNLKKANSASNTHSITRAEPISWAENQAVASGPFCSNGLGKDLMV